MEKRRSPKTYASQTKTKTAESARSPTGSAEALTRTLQSPSTETPRQTIEKKTVKIQVNTDNHIAGREALSQQAEATVASALGHLAEHIVPASKSISATRTATRVALTTNAA